MKYPQSIALLLMLLLATQAKASFIFQEYTNTRLAQGSTFFTHTFDAFDTSLGTLTQVQFDGFTQVQFDGFTQVAPVYDSFHCGEAVGCDLSGEAWAVIVPFSLGPTIQTTGHSTTIFGNPSTPTGAHWVASVVQGYYTGLDDFINPPQFNWHGDAYCPACLSSSDPQYNLSVRSSISYTYTPTAVGLPSSMALLSVGLVGLLSLLRRRAISI